MRREERSKRRVWKFQGDHEEERHQYVQRASRKIRFCECVLVMENFITCMLFRGQRTSSSFKESKNREEKTYRRELMNGIWVVEGMGNSFSHYKRKGVDVSQGPPKKRKGDVMQIHDVINTPPVLGENAPTSSRQSIHVVCPLDFMIELVLHNSFSWVFRSYMLKFDISLWISLLNNNNFACFFVASFKSTNMKWSDIKTNSYIWDSFCYNK